MVQTTKCISALSNNDQNHCSIDSHWTCRFGLRLPSRISHASVSRTMNAFSPSRCSVTSVCVVTPSGIDVPFPSRSYLRTHSTVDDTAHFWRETRMANLPAWLVESRENVLQTQVSRSMDEQREREGGGAVSTRVTRFLRSGTI